MFKYWKEFTLFSVITTVYVICTTPALSWAGFDCDLGDFMYSAKYGGVLHFPGFPIYAALSWLIVRIPVGTEGFRMALFLSALPSIITCVLVFLAVKKQTLNAWSPYVAAMALAGANIFLMQSIIAEVYALTTMLLAATYTAIIYGRYRVAAVFAGLTASMHIMALPAVIAFFIWSKEFRSRWRIFIPAAIVPYIYVVFMGATRESFSMMGSGFWGFLQYVVGTVSDNMQWWLSLPMWRIPEKIGLTIIVFVVAFGLALIPMLKQLWDWRRSGILLAAIVIPSVYFFGCVVGLAVVHLMLAIPFMAIAAGLGINKIRMHPAPIFACSVILLVVMPLNYDIGRTLDKNLAAETVYESFSEILEGAIVVNLCRWESEDGIGDTILGGISGREQTLLYIYSKESGIDIVPLNISAYVSDLEVPGFGNAGVYYREQLSEKYQINTPFVDLGEDVEDKEKYWANAVLIAESNPERGLYYTLIDRNSPLDRRLIRYEKEDQFVTP